MNEILMAYFSRRGDNYWNGSIRNLKKGNTEVVAEKIKTITDGDLFEIKTKKEYPEDYTACTEDAMAELRSKARPELASLPETTSYKTLILGYPNWWGTIPMAVATFLESINTEGMTILPFCTNEGSGMGRSEKDIKELCPKAAVKKGLSIHGAEAEYSDKAVERWLKDTL